MKQFSEWRTDSTTKVLEETDKISTKDEVSAKDAIRSMLGESGDYLRKTIGNKFGNIDLSSSQENLIGDLNKLEETILKKLEEAHAEEDKPTIKESAQVLDDYESINESSDPLLDYYKLYRDR